MSDNQLEWVPAPKTDPFLGDVTYEVTPDGRGTRDSGVDAPIYGLGVLDTAITEALPAGGRVGALPPAYRSVLPGTFYFEVDADPAVRPRMWIGRRYPDPASTSLTNEALVVDYLPPGPTGTFPTIGIPSFDAVGNFTVPGAVTTAGQIEVCVFLVNPNLPVSLIGVPFITWTKATMNGLNWTITFPNLPAGTYTPAARYRASPDWYVRKPANYTYTPTNILLP